MAGSYLNSRVTYILIALLLPISILSSERRDMNFFPFLDFVHQAVHLGEFQSIVLVHSDSAASSVSSLSWRKYLFGSADRTVHQIVIQKESNISSPEKASLQRATRRYSSMHNIIIAQILSELYRKELEAVSQAISKSPHCHHQSLNYHIFITTPPIQNNLLQLHALHWNFKYKVIVSDINNAYFSAKVACLHCTIQEPVNSYKPTATRTAAIKLYQVFLDFTRNLYGYTLPVSLSSRIPGIQVRTVANKVVPYRTGGQNLRFLLVAAEHLNFTPSLFHSTGGGATGLKLPNGTWNGLIGDVLYGKAAIGCCPIISEQRYKVVTSLTAIDYVSVVFLHRNAQHAVNLDFILLPFTNAIWRLLVLSTVLTLLITKLIFYVLAKYLPQGYSVWNTSEISMVLYRSYVGQGATQVRNLVVNAMRILFVCWLIFTIVISTAYTSVLYKLYMRLPTEEVPATFEELANSDYEIGQAFYGGALYKLFQIAHPGTASANVFKRMKKLKPPACWTAALLPNFACVTFDLDVKFFINSQTPKAHPEVSIEAPQMQMIDSVVVSKNSILYESLDKVLQRLNDGGFWYYWLQRTFEDLRLESLQKGQLKRRQQADDIDSLTLKLKHFGGLALTIVSVAFLSIVVFIVECFVHFIHRCRHR